MERSPEEERIRVAYHEAGHAVVGYVLCMGIEEIIIKDGNGGYAEHTLDFETAEIKLGERVARENVALKLVAGELAQCRQGYDVYGNECNDDHANFRDHVEKLCWLDYKGPPPLPEPIYRENKERLRKQADEIIESHWQQIEPIANALLEHNVLSGADAISIIRRN